MGSARNAFHPAARQCFRVSEEEKVKHLLKKTLNENSFVMQSSLDFIRQVIPQNDIIAAKQDQVNDLSKDKDEGERKVVEDIKIKFTQKVARAVS